MVTAQVEFNMKNKRPSMEEIWMQTSIDLSKRSKCELAQVGCIITTKDLRKVLGNGYNGGAKGSGYVCKENNCSCLHAENNAVIDAGSLEKDKVFFVTMFPCLPCAIQIINSGASKIYYHNDYKEGSKHWFNYEKTVKMLKKCKIIICKL